MSPAPVTGFPGVAFPTPRPPAAAALGRLAVSVSYGTSNEDRSATSRFTVESRRGTDEVQSHQFYKDIIAAFKDGKLTSIRELPVVRHGPFGWSSTEGRELTYPEYIANARRYGDPDFQQTVLNNDDDITPLPSKETVEKDEHAALLMEIAWYFDYMVHAEARSGARRLIAPPSIPATSANCTPTPQYTGQHRLDLKGWLPYCFAWPNLKRPIFIIRSNRMQMPTLPESSSRPCALHYDARYGRSEACWLPQWDDSSRPHMAFIPCLQFDHTGLLPSAALADGLWYFLTHDDNCRDPAFYRVNWDVDFQQDAPGIFRMRRPLSLALCEAIKRVLDMWNAVYDLRHCGTPASVREHWRAHAPSDKCSLLMLTYTYLAFERGTALEIRDALAEFQRSLLEIRGWCQYCTALGVYKIALDRRAETMDEINRALQYNAGRYARGVFTRSKDAAERYSASDVPVWLVQPYQQSDWAGLVDAMNEGTAERGKIFFLKEPQVCCDPIEWRHRPGNPDRPCAYLMLAEAGYSASGFEGWWKGVCTMDKSAAPAVPIDPGMCGQDDDCSADVHAASCDSLHLLDGLSDLVRDADVGCHNPNPATLGSRAADRPECSDFERECTFHVS
ncbi:hypothetical protein AURDEDRAFT_178223 [Auricularia subglabra TFB-10046 SS5]|uniref:Uncharacterized protein n=1 Tax=Auricularia subglabra (strain TFB-10046 / SS5) TaxID=717982 RepID=J0CR18_AURST|nr:hypothetical protein AURDEDRAFT_178223 [Auricularia subglabra TFB-10046 SS5]